MQSILDAINEWIKEILIGAINGNLSTMFGDVNEKVGTIANEVGQTPQGWNANIFSMIQTLSENVIVPIAGLVITYVLCYELISMVTEKNNMHDIETFMFFKWIFKAFVAVFIVTNTFNITMAVFDMAQHIVSGAAGVIGGDTNIDVAEALVLIDRAAEGEQTVHFLNQVDEADLMALTENGEAAKKPEICNCTEKCEAGKVNTSCPVCVTSMTGCTGKEPTPTPTEQPEEPKEKSGNPGVVLALVLFALLGGGAAFYYFKFLKPKQNVKGDTDLEDFEFEDYDEDEPEADTGETSEDEETEEETL